MRCYKGCGLHSVEVAVTLVVGMCGDGEGFMLVSMDV